MTEIPKSKIGAHSSKPQRGSRWAPRRWAPSDLLTCLLKWAKAAGLGPLAARMPRLNIGLEATGGTEGKQAAELGGKLFQRGRRRGPTATLSDAKQLAVIEDMANLKWDSVAILPFSINTEGAGRENY